MIRMVVNLGKMSDGLAEITETMEDRTRQNAVRDAISSVVRVIALDEWLRTLLKVWFFLAQLRQRWWNNKLLL